MILSSRLALDTGADCKRYHKTALLRGAGDMPAPRQDLRMRTLELVTALALARCVVLVGDASESVARFNPLNATYIVGDDKVKLVDGKAMSKPAQPGSAIRTITKIVVRPALGRKQEAILSFPQHRVEMQA